MQPAFVLSEHFGDTADGEDVSNGRHGSGCPSRGFFHRPPIPRQQFIELLSGMIGDAGENIGQPGLRIGLQNAGEGREMAPRMFAGSVARITKQSRWRILSTEGAVVAHIGPTSRDVGLSLGQHRHGRVVAMHPLGGEDMILKLLAPPQFCKWLIRYVLWTPRAPLLPEKTPPAASTA